MTTQERDIPIAVLSLKKPWSQIPETPSTLQLTAQLWAPSCTYVEVLGLSYLTLSIYSQDIAQTHQNTIGKLWIS
jgi:hypothetical protein